MSRVVQGTDAIRGSWPWQIAIYTQSGNFICGGSTLSPDWIISAAHCFRDENPSKFYVVVGDTDRFVGLNSSNRKQNRRRSYRPLEVRKIGKRQRGWKAGKNVKEEFGTNDFPPPGDFFRARVFSLSGYFFDYEFVLDDSIA